MSSGHIGHSIWYNGDMMKSPEFLTAGTAIGRRRFLARMAGAVAAAPATAIALVLT